MASNAKTPANVLAMERYITSVNPATGELLAEFVCATEAEVRAVVERARGAQPAWAQVDVRERVAVVRRFQQLLQERKAEVGQLITREAGKPYLEALSTEVLVVLDAARFCAQNTFAFLRPEPVPHGNPMMKAKRGHILREPHGVIGIISPWNYPFSTPAIEALTALALGNAVVLKPSELTPLVGHELVSMLHSAGVPEGVLQLVIGDGATGAALIDAPIDKVIFTGSVATGKRVAQAAAKRLLPVLLELGGKDPMLVLDDADIDIAAQAAVWGAFVNAGQTCLSVERCYVDRKLYPAFLEAVVARTQALRVGNGLDPETDIGPLIRERQLQIVEAQVEDARAEGARVLTGGQRLPEVGPTFYAPTVLTGVDHSMRLMQEETFGPVLPIMAIENEEEAIRFANDSQFGLAASVWTRNRRRGERVARQLNAGTVMVNDVISCFGISEAPHGGFGSSGIGRTHGRMGMEEMVRIKYVDSDRLPSVPKPWWYRYGGAFIPQMEGLIDFLFGHGIVTRMRGGIRSLPAVLRSRRQATSGKP
jgi:succinate-semialdehyde dehydrogenase/glutarate-semialdehyde dehydrogenase